MKDWTDPTITHPYISRTTVIQEGTKIHPSVQIGEFCLIEKGAILEEDVVIGHYTHIARNVKVVAGTILGNYVETQPETIIGDLTAGD